MVLLRNNNINMLITAENTLIYNKEKNKSKEFC